MTLHHLEELAMKLSPADRERLASHLLASVSASAPSDIDQAWTDESERRLDELLQGKVEAIEGDEFFELVGRDLGWKV